MCSSNMTGNVTVSINPLPTAYNVTGGGAYCSGGTGIPVGLSNSQSGVNYQLSSMELEGQQTRERVYP